jgi:nucleoside 2-deoxyribosyltransferase
MRPKVVLCGSFHRLPQQLKRLFRELETSGCRVLSPISLDFDTAAFVRAEAEADLSVAEIEKFHLRAIRDADFLMLHAPDGHVGTSASYEMGFASALGKPVFVLESPIDDMLTNRVRVVGSVFEILDQLQLTSF